jgi:hypothetical protein
MSQTAALLCVIIPTTFAQWTNRMGEDTAPDRLPLPSAAVTVHFSAHRPDVLTVAESRKLLLELKELQESRRRAGFIACTRHSSAARNRVGRLTLVAYLVLWLEEERTPEIRRLSGDWTRMDPRC